MADYVAGMKPTGGAIAAGRVLEVAKAQAPRLTASPTPRAGTSAGHFTIKRPFIPSLK